VKHAEPVWRNAAGDIVAKEEALGHKSSYELIHPEMLVFVDEVDSNTSQTKDGHVGGQTYLCTKEGRPQQRAATRMPILLYWDSWPLTESHSCALLFLLLNL
jgi:hypothetical protein